ncbi:hypothetical protein [Nocardia sp. NPDC024068]|uniref:hypothetical protein n=1 Tax=Nocardia sp. NPDC024068 TaxID=3157197 RepID=UPI0033FBED62
MDAENASLGDERRAPQEEYGRGQWDSESRGFAGFGSHGFDSANGSNGATNRSDSIPDHGYTWTPAPLSTPTQTTGGSAAMDPFAAWNTGDAPGQVMTSVGQDTDTRYPVPPPDNPPFSTPPEDDPSGAETTALPTRGAGRPSRSAAPADSAPMPQISQPGGSAPALSSSSRIPAPGTPYPAHSTDPTIPTAGSPAPPTTHLPASGSESDYAGPGSQPAAPGNPEDRYPEPVDTDSFTGSSADTGSLPSWLSSIGEEAVPHSLETGGRRRKLDPADTGESPENFNPFEDQHALGLSEDHAPGLSGSQPSGLSESQSTGLSGALPADIAEQYPLPGDPGPEQATQGLPTRTPRSPEAAAPGTGEQSAAPARRLPRSAARHAPDTDESAPVTSPRDTLTRGVSGESDIGLPTRTTDIAESDSTPGQLPARRLPRSAGRYKPGDSSDAPARDPESGGLRPIGTAADSGDPEPAGNPAEAAAPPRLAPPDGTPILDRLLDPEPAHGTDDDESGSPVSEILTRILESGHEAPESRHAGTDDTGTEPDSPELPTARRSTASALTLVPDAADTAPETTESDSDSRPPLETRRSRRAREAAEASAAASVSSAPAPAAPEPAEQPQPALPSLPELSVPSVPSGSEQPETGRPAAPADSTSRHGRPEEGADIDIHVIMRLLTASDDLEILAGKAEKGDVSADEVARTAREARTALLSAISAWYGGPAQMVKFANALLQAARES